ncbi:MAG TPA: hypothetical protein DIW31_07995 [Bacteroidales bacterium]|nr:hypothetical protein [Bacteroidales bacterium]
MKATDFNLSKDIVYDVHKGMTTFKDTRLVIFDANAIGLLRQSIVKELGWDKSRALFFKFGYQHGFADFLQMKTNYEFDSEMDLLASGPVIHTWEGIVQATPREIRFDREKGEFYFTGVWSNSYEAQQYLSYNNEATEPVCWTLMGYASGWCTAFFGKKVLAVEPVCMGKGDSHCEWLIQNLDAWDDRAKPFLPIINLL